jgi:hemoglobin
MGLVLVLVLAAACGGGNKKEDPMGAGGGGGGGDEKSLYDRLGGKDAITKVVDDFVNTAATDGRIKEFFTNTDAAALKAKLVDQICEGTGGPCKYSGKDMKTVHTGMKITEDHFNALVEDFVKALDKFKVPEKEKTEVLGILGGMKGDVVGL